MLRVVVSELVHRRSRTLALLLGILVATTSFAVLTGTSESQRLEVRGTVAGSFRGTYDVLVRPRGSHAVFERRTGQVQPNFLSGLFGGISTAQWRQIERLPGVDVAAPIANLGYVLPTAKIPVDVSEAARGRGRALLRARIAFRSDGGLTRVPDAAEYAYVTPNPLRGPPGDETLPYFRRWALREEVPGRARPLPVCNEILFGNRGNEVIDGPYSPLFRSGLGCFSRATGEGRFGFDQLRRMAPAVQLRWTFPMLLTAVDPVAEARLTGLDQAVVGGRYLRRSDASYVDRIDYQGYRGRQRFLPVMVASRTYLGETAELAVERLSPTATARWTRPFAIDENDWSAPLRFLIRQPAGPVVQRARVSADRGYRHLLEQLRGADYDVQEISTIWRVGPTRSTDGEPPLRPRTTPADDTVWQSNESDAGLFWAHAPPAARDRQFRAITRVQAFRDGGETRPADDLPFIRSVGVFDPERLRQRGGAGAAPLTALQPPLLTARNGAQTPLGTAPLRPNGNLGGYAAQPPGLLTTMNVVRAFGRPLFPDLDPDRAISAIRVRVAGVTGIDAVSRERIRQAAERIAAATGLDVDVTAGASGAPTPVDLPAGRFGRPLLALSELWVRKGVATQVLTAVDRKSVVLFGLILVVCALFVANAASAAVRARRSELGVLASLGWTTKSLFGVVLLEVGTVGLVAGILGGLLALPLAELVGVTASLDRLALAVVAATVLALLAGVVPAARAARADPVAAVRPLVLEAGRAWRPRTIGQLALVNLVRTPGRTALAALSLAIGVCALTLLLAATVAFRDTLVGTLLGNAVAVDIRTTDYIAVAATILLGAASVADVLFLNLRERASELATLRATGWDETVLGRLVALEGLWIGALGGLLGAMTGLAAAALFAGTVPLTLVLVTLAAAAGGALLAAVSALAPAAWLRRTSLIPLLAGD
jgi:hypothetical protein